MPNSKNRKKDERGNSNRKFSSKYGSNKLNSSDNFRESKEKSTLKKETKKISIKSKIYQDKRQKIIEKRKKIKTFSRPQLEKNNKIGKRKRKIFTRTSILILLIPLIIIIITVTFIQTKLFDVKNIKVVGNKSVEVSELQKHIENNGGNGLIFNISPARLKNSIEQSFGLVKSANISKDLPSTLTITLEEYVPKVILQTKNNAYLVGTEGNVLYANIDVERLKDKYPLLKVDDETSYKIKDVFSVNIIEYALRALDLAKLEGNVTGITLKIYPDKSADANLSFENGKIWIVTLTKKDLLGQYIILRQVNLSKNYKTLDTRFAESYIIN